MGEAFDIELDLYQKIWDALEGYAEWSEAIPVGNRIRYDEPSDDPNLSGDSGDEDKSVMGDGDFPQCVVDHVSGTSTMFDQDLTFGTHSDKFCNWVERSQHVFRITLTSQTLSFKESSNLGKLTRNAIRLAGPRLGTEYVIDVQIEWKTRRERVGDEDETWRARTTILLKVTVDYDGKTLEGE